MKGPELFSGGRVHGHHARVRGGHIHGSIDHQRCGFTGDKARAAAPPAATAGALGSLAIAATTAASRGDEAFRPHVVDPRHLEPIDVRGLDLRQRREAHAAGVVAVRGPFLRQIRCLAFIRLRECARQRDENAGCQESAPRSLHTRRKHITRASVPLVPQASAPAVLTCGKLRA